MEGSDKDQVDLGELEKAASSPVKFIEEFLVDKHLEMVDDFHHKFDLNKHYNPFPARLDWDLAQFRLNFLLEELLEMAHAHKFKLVLKPDRKPFFAFDNDNLGPVDMAKFFDGIIDLEYVLKGTVLLAGLDQVYEEGFSRVHAANMAKVKAESAEHSAETTGRGHFTDIVKPEGWKPAVLDDLVAQPKDPTL